MADKKENISKEDLATMSFNDKVTFLKEIYLAGEYEDDAMFNDILSSIIKDKESGAVPSEELNEGQVIIDEIYSTLSESGELQKLKSNKSLKEGVRNTFDLLTSASDLFTANKQISEGQEASDRSVRPNAPRRYNLDPTVSRSINESLRGLSPSGIEAQLNPAKEDIRDTFIAGQSANRVASSGNAGNFAALSQANVNRRYDALRDLSGIRAGIRDNMLRNLNYSLQNRLNERRLQQQRDLSVYNTELNQFNREQQSAGELERAGRINRRNSIFNLGRSILPIIDNTIDGDSGISEVASVINEGLSNNQTNPTVNDPYLNSFDSKLPSTNFDTSIYDGRDIDEIFNTNLIVNPLRGRLIR